MAVKRGPRQGTPSTRKQHRARDNGHRKVRLAAQSAGSRRIKCDEAKPSCRRCITAHTVCDFASSSSQASLIPGLTVSASPLQQTADERELTYLFRTKLILTCSDEFNEDLLNIYIPLASQSQALIWYASVAFVALWRYQMAKSRRRHAVQAANVSPDIGTFAPAVGKGPGGSPTANLLHLVPMPGLELKMLWTAVRAVSEELSVQLTAKQTARAHDSQLRFRDAFDIWDDSRCTSWPESAATRRLRRRIVDLLRPLQSMVRLLNVEEDHSPTQIQETIMAVEEGGWATAKIGRPECNCLMQCVPEVCICSNRRVVAVDVNLRPGTASELCLRTCADVLNKRPGHVVFVAKPILLCGF
ncbi:hypothetical protein LLEC1_07896 [Akanthomyces lecanii]|uniref:Zn(2)-C6 fungal-type domain-containing protein n=1 Tax=Cordyceps confragosa TaxID=2714763 RepID=A0A179IGP2_CORDF|nr:hypothetical protein LLEC1_07896 [Akanthomyces lecanii]